MSGPQDPSPTETTSGLQLSDGDGKPPVTKVIIEPVGAYILNSHTPVVQLLIWKVYAKGPKELVSNPLNGTAIFNVVYGGAIEISTTGS